MKILKNKLYEPFSVLIIIIFSLILFTPGNMGEFYDAEVWKVWAASKLLITTGKFLQNTLGPLYYSLLTFLSPFNRVIIFKSISKWDNNVCDEVLPNGLSFNSE